MMRLPLLALVFFVFGDVGSSQQAPPTLVKVFVAMRHGSRAPSYETYKNDSYNKDDKRYWPAGAGELTKKGKEEAFLLGQKLKLRYNDFLGDYYQPKEFKAYSTLKERTIMSAQLVLAALFPPVGYQAWRENLDWQPVPVLNDYVVNRTDDINCPWLLVSTKADMKNASFSEYGLSMDDIDLIEDYMGSYDNDTFTFMSKLWDIWDTLYYEEKEGYTLPDWVKTVYPNKMAAAVLKFVKFYLSGTVSRKEILIAPYGKALAEYFTKSQRKMELHTWHDMNIIALMTLLGLKIESYPAPTASVAIELHNKSGEHFLEVYYYNDSSISEPNLMRMPCGTSCLSADLIAKFKTYGEKNFEELCYSKNGVANNLKNAKALLYLPMIFYLATKFIIFK